MSFYSKMVDKLKAAGMLELVQGSSTALSFKVLGALSGYFFTFLIARYDGAEILGLFVLALTVLKVAALFGHIGINKALLKYISAYYLKKEWGAIQQIYLKGLAIAIITSICTAIILYFFAHTIAVLIFNKPVLQTAFEYMAFVIVPFVGIHLNANSLRGLKNIKAFTFLIHLSIFMFATLALFILYFIFQDSSSYTPVYAYLIGAVITWILSFVVWFRNFPFRRIKKNLHIKAISAKQLIQVALPMLISISMLLIMGWTDTFMLGILSTNEKVGIYNIALRIAMVTSFTTTAVNSIAAPKFSEYFNNKIYDKFKQTVQHASRMMFWSAFPIVIIIFIFPGFLLNIFGEEFLKGIIPLLILTIGHFINAFSGSVGYILQMTGKQVVFQNILLVATVINILLNFFLIKLYGMQGAAIATAISIVIWNLSAVVYIWKEYRVMSLYLPGLYKLNKTQHG